MLNYEIKKTYIIKIEEHNYIYNNLILNDLKYNGSIIINKKCSNTIYFRQFLILMSINNNKYNLRDKQLLSLFKEKYGDIKFKIGGLSEEYKEYIIKKFNICNDIKYLNDKKFNEYITPELIAHSAAMYLYNLNRKKTY